MQHSFKSKNLPMLRGLKHKMKLYINNVFLSNVMYTVQPDKYLLLESNIATRVNILK